MSRGVSLPHRDHRGFALALGALGAMLAVAPEAAQAAGVRWRATSTTAISITGNIVVKGDRVTFGNGASIAIADVAPDRPGVAAVSPPANPKLLRGNTLCGDQPATFLAFALDGPGLL